MKSASPTSFNTFLSLLSADANIATPVLSGLQSPRDTCNLAEILPEQNEEEGVDHDAGATIIRRFSQFSSIISPSRTGRRSLLYAVPVIPQDVQKIGALPYTRPAPTNQSLILGTDSFTTYHPTSSRLQNIYWKYLGRHQSVTFLFTITAHCRDRDATEPGVLTGKDIFIEHDCSFLRLAIGKGLAITRDWGIFRCFSYPDDANTRPSREAGLLRIPLTLVSRPRKPQSQCFLPYVDYDLERECTAIPDQRKYSALLLFPLGYTSATVTHLIQHPAPPMFDMEVREQSMREWEYQAGSQVVTDPVVPTIAENDELFDDEEFLDDEIAVETSSLYRSSSDE